MNYSSPNDFRIKTAAIPDGNAPGIRYPLEDRLPLIAILLSAVDFVVIASLGFLTDAAYHRFVYDEQGSAMAPSIAIAVAFLFTLQQAFGGRYKTSHLLASGSSVGSVTRGWVSAILVMLVIGFLLKEAALVSRGAFVLFTVIGLPVIAAVRGVTVLILQQAVKTERLKARRIVLVGARDDIERYFLAHDLWRSGISVAASVIVENSLEEPLTVWTADSQREIGHVRIGMLAGLLRPLQADDIVLALPWSAAAGIDQLVREVIHLPATIYLAPDPNLGHLEGIFADRTGLRRAITDHSSGVVGLKIISRPLSPFERLTKRVFDMTASAAGIVLLSPFALVISAAIVLESRGSPIYRQERNGFNEKPFSIFKFRSMVAAPAADFRQTTRNDPRITRVGRFLRRTNLDEVPQLLNVLLGEMSLVGPRPLAVAHNNAFVSRIERYARRHHVKPGITGWAQVNGWRGSAEDTHHMSMRVAHDLEYINNWSLWLDIKIIVMTLTSSKAFKNAF